MQYFLGLSAILFFLPAFGQRLKKLATLEARMAETSGLVAFTDSTFLTINDGGNRAELYEIDKRGKIVSITIFSNAENFDWEELQMDEQGIIYIGDIGNNSHSRNQLTIYKFHRDLVGKTEVETEAIHFFYEDQLYFPPAAHERNFDSEAFLVKGDSLFIFSKDWSKPFSGDSKVYYVPNQPGRHTAKLLRKFHTNGTANFRDAVTSVCWFGDQILLLTYSSVYHIKDTKELLFTDHFVQSKRYLFRRVKQFEAVTVGLDGKVYLTAEKHRYLGRAKLYLWTGMEKK
jgi:hypothetical protein